MSGPFSSEQEARICEIIRQEAQRLLQQFPRVAAGDVSEDVRQWVLAGIRAAARTLP